MNLGFRRFNRSNVTVRRVLSTATSTSCKGLLSGIKDVQKDVFYSSALNIEQVSKGSKDSACILEAAKKDAVDGLAINATAHKEDAMSVDQYLKTIQSRVDQWIAKKEIADRPIFLSRMNSILEDGGFGQLVCMVGGNNAGKSFLCKTLSTKMCEKTKRSYSAVYVDMRAKRNLLMTLLDTLKKIDRVACREVVDNVLRSWASEYHAFELNDGSIVKALQGTLRHEAGLVFDIVTAISERRRGTECGADE